MVISLESQNVKTKKTYYMPLMRVRNIKIRITNPVNVFNNINISDRYVPYIISLFLFSLLFSRGLSLFVPVGELRADLKSIVLPYHSADVVSKDDISNYESYAKENLYSEVTLYSGETLSGISTQYGVSKETILQVNGIKDVKKLDEITALSVPSTSGFLHTVANGETLEQLSTFYDVPIKDIFRINNLKSENIGSLDSIFIPDVNPILYGWRSNLDHFFVYPLDGYISKRYGFHTNSITGITSLYQGIDFVPSENRDVYASRAGYISRIGYSANYGNYIYIDHVGGVRTLYGHLNSVDISIRDRVEQGQVIGKVGKSGFTTKSKLFFGMFVKEESVDPEKYLR